MKPFGLILIFIAAIVPLYWYVPLAWQHDSLATISQYLGSVSLILMGIVQFMATRFRGIEAIFGSMDRVYALHKWLSVTAILFAAIHDTVDADMEGLGSDTFLTDVAETMGELGFYGLLVLGIITIITFIPYHYWKWSHRFMGLFFALSVVHFAFILKPFSNGDLLGLYILAFCGLGVLSYIYLLLPKTWTSQTVDYEVANVALVGDITEIQLTPKGHGIKHKAGQFAFVTFDTKDKEGPHPFTISSAPNQKGDISFTIKNLGDYTARLPHSLKQGTTAKLSRAFGRFTPSKKSQQQIWIAAGIGITPFIAWAQTLGSSHSTPVRLYYCIAARDKAMYIELLESITNKVASFELVLVVSGVDKRLSAVRINGEVNADLAACDVYFCGPSAMRESLKADFTELGLQPSAFHYEEFEIRSSIGILKMLNWLALRYRKLTAALSLGKVDVKR